MADSFMRLTMRLSLAVTLAVLGLGAARNASAQHLPSAMHMMDWGRGSLVLFDELEYVPSGEGRPVKFDALGWYGGAVNRLWIRSEGELSTRSSEGEVDTEVLFGRLVSPYWDALVGVRIDTQWEEESATRALLSIGLLGLAPLRFEFAPTLFVGKDGDVSARLDTSYQFLFTQRLVLEPSLDANLSTRAAPRFGVGTGLNEVVLATRLRYEIRRKLGPYVGLAWTRRVGSTAELARAAGKEAGELDLVFGVRVWR